MALWRTWGQPMVSVTIYVEGGGDSNSLRTRCRKGFSAFFRKAGFEGRMPRVVACGSRDDAYRKFCLALQDTASDRWPILLVDSEEAVRQNNVWHHLQARDNWSRPGDADEQQAHLMVQCMENWFLADVDALKNYFGQGFRRNSLPNRDDVENVSKADVFNRLQDASWGSRKGRYDKGRHSFEILERLDVNRVKNCSPFANRLITNLQENLS